MPLWSRLSQSKTATPRAATAPAPPLAQGGNSRALKSWLKKLPSMPCNSLLDVSLTCAVDLTHMDRSGKNQLFSGRKTRLSTLIRDNVGAGKPSFSQSLVKAKRIRRHAHGTFADFGVETGFLASGFVEGKFPEPETDGKDGNFSAGRDEDENRPGHKGPGKFSCGVRAPVFLLPVQFSNKYESNDIEVQITGKSIFNPALEAWLENCGVRLNSRRFVSAAYGTSRFEPEAALDLVRALLAETTSLTVKNTMWLSTFIDVADILVDPVVSSSHEIIEMLAYANSEDLSQREQARAYQAVEEQKFDEYELEPLEERDVDKEFHAVDADADQQAVLDYAKAGFSFTVTAPPGTGQLQTVINLLAQAVVHDKKVLIMSQSRAETVELFRNLDRLGLSSLVARVANLHKENYLRDAFIAGVLRNEKMEEPEIRGLQSMLVDHRHRLKNHVESLHTVRQRWGCSPREAMQALAALTALNPPPQTVVRLERSVLDAISEEEHNLDETKAILKRAAVLGAFDAEITSSPWYGASLRNQKEVERAQELARGLNDDILAFAHKMDEVAQYAHIQRPGTFEEWQSYLLLLNRMRQSLDKFTPDIFERPLEDLIEATASNAWRRDHGVEVTSMQRSRLRRVAKEYIRPGMYITDLHQSLLDVEGERISWEKISTSRRNPAIPSGLSELSKVYERLSEELGELSVIVANTRGGGGLRTLPVDSLLNRLHALSLNDYTLDALPERTILLEQMQEKGLGKFLDDLCLRNVPEDRVEQELDLAWWQSVLEAMISGDDFLAMNDGDTLRRLEAEYRLADSAYIAQGANRVKWELARRWSRQIAENKAEAAILRQMLKNGSIDAALLWRETPGLISPIVPVWIASPYEVTTKIPAYSNAFDMVIIMGAESVHDAAALAGVGRATQVVALGDLSTGMPQSLFSGPGFSEKNGKTPVKLKSIMEGLMLVLPNRDLRYSYRSNDMKLVEYLSKNLYGGKLHRLHDSSLLVGAPARLEVEYVEDGTGLPTIDSDGVEAVAAEVNRVANLVFEHAKTKPGRSLGVISASEKTAQAIAEAVRVQLPNFPLLTDFFKDSEEAFVVKSVTQAAGIVRDDIIFSLGFGRTVHGRAVHTFGVFSESDGEKMFGRALTRARGGLLVVSSVKPGDLDAGRLSHGARRFYDLLKYCEGSNRKIYVADKRQDEAERAGLEGIHEVRKKDVDPLVADLVMRLKMLDLRAWQNYDGAIDMVVANGPDDAPSGKVGALLPLVLSSDGSKSYREMTVRERHRQRPEQFERLGWRYMPLWTIEVFGDPQAIAEKIAGYLGVNIAARNVMPFESNLGEGRTPEDGFDARKLLEESDRRYNEKQRSKIGDDVRVERQQPIAASAEVEAGASIFAQVLAAQQSDSLEQSVVRLDGKGGEGVREL